ncbi:rhomboid-like protein 11, chloroplastic isoform X3 [Ziziphus jujuba]|uniref:Rhomboid-like protein 11, chloroplastic isoform X3 n=1 Tax=Ziziphus jujuba TaxID=326968 RepID=A0ABM4AAJ7_ZIZJJ|nr:rhomboid-like protein 11, chloroplastic isoform X3 [Ziziphus jujuba]
MPTRPRYSCQGEAMISLSHPLSLNVKFKPNFFSISNTKTSLNFPPRISISRESSKPNGIHLPLHPIPASRSRTACKMNGSGKLVEEEEGNFALWLSYILTGVGANLVSWLVLPRNAVSVGASGAVFGLFTISVLVKMSWDWRKILEVLILGQFVIEKVMDAAQASTALSGPFRGGHALQSINHIAHLSGALVGVLLVWLLRKVPSDSPDQ